MLQAALPVRRAAFQALLSGRPVAVEEVSSAAGLSVETARKAARDVASVGMAEIIDGTVIGMDGLTTRPTQHSITLGGVDLWTWCAYDIVGIAAALGTTAEGRTRCGACGQTIEVEIREGTPHGTSVIGWLPSESCANVMAEFCPSALLFCSSEHLDDWRAASGQAQGEALNLPALAERGREEWRQLVS
jgi:alkylmercury lyase